ncbi:interferon a3-like [Sardina pilchardus]|uniref:interferon a3-like n=1 Tax=Sardina pilchardus TaxID=27697 RepID=UPI002E11CCD2
MDRNVTAEAWDQKKLKDFMSTLDTQLVATQSCVVSKNKETERLHLYFEDLRNVTLGTMENKTKASELIRKEVHHHLTKVDLLASTRL